MQGLCHPNPLLSMLTAAGSIYNSESELSYQRKRVLDVNGVMPDPCARSLAHVALQSRRKLTGTETADGEV
jgi:hypothetical protein